MRIENLDHHYNKLPGDSAHIIVPGINGGIESDFIKLIEEHLEDRAYMSFNFPFMKDKCAPSTGLLEEASALLEVMKFMQGEGYSDLHIVAKSLGGIVTSKLLSIYPPNNVNNVDVTILGYVIGDEVGSVDTKVIGPYLNAVIQGSDDRYGNANAIKKELSHEGFSKVPVYSIEGADHSYRAPDGTDKFKREAISYITV